MQYLKNHYLIILIILLANNKYLIAQCHDYSSIEDKIINLGDVSFINDTSDYPNIRRGTQALKFNEDFTNFTPLKELLKGVEIVLLGEQSHGEGTTYWTKIKLIKYLHQELGFDLLLFESGFYDCKKAWELIEQGEDARVALSKSIFPIWSYTKEFEALTNYIQQSFTTPTPLTTLGFDSQFSNDLSEKHYVKDLANFLSSIDSSLISTQKWMHLTASIEKSMTYDQKIKKEEVKTDTAFINELIARIPAEQNNSSYWIQTLKNAKVQLSDYKLGTDYRDEQMAKNLIWIKENYPNKKIICWGATSHFLYNSKEVRMKNTIVQLLAGYYYKKHFMMGHYIKEKYGDLVYNIGFTTYQGKFGLFKVKKIKAAQKNSLEHLLNQSSYDHFLLPLKDLSFSGCPSRPLGNYYMKNDISNQMDAVIFNRKMNHPWYDAAFHIKIQPNSFLAKYWQKKYPGIYSDSESTEQKETQGKASID